MEICFYCPFLDDLNMDSAPPYVVCHGRRPGQTWQIVYAWLTLFELARIRRNVSQACREMGVPRRAY